MHLPELLPLLHAKRGWRSQPARVTSGTHLQAAADSLKKNKQTNPNQKAKKPKQTKKPHGMPAKLPLLVWHKKPHNKHTQTHKKKAPTNLSSFKQRKHLVLR